jgi:isopentenyldiphosphate isomerase
MAEMLDVYNLETNEYEGRQLRSLCHGNPALLHRTSQVVVIHPETGDVLLQKRKLCKEIQPGKWDTAVGGHLDCGEDYLTCALRELKEELGFSATSNMLEVLFDSKIRNEIESEDVRVFGIKTAGPFIFQESEIDEIKFWSKEELAQANKNIFTPNLVAQLKELKYL